MQAIPQSVKPLGTIKDLTSQHLKSILSLTYFNVYEKYTLLIVKLENMDKVKRDNLV